MPSSRRIRDSHPPLNLFFSSSNACKDSAVINILGTNNIHLETRLLSTRNSTLKTTMATESNNDPSRLSAGAESRSPTHLGRLSRSSRACSEPGCDWYPWSKHYHGAGHDDTSNSSGELPCFAIDNHTDGFEQQTLNADAPTLDLELRRIYDEVIGRRGQKSRSASEREERTSTLSRP